jgi:ATP-binding cassette subfamily B protein
MVKNHVNAKVLRKIDTIEFKNLSFKYDKDDLFYALDNINITLNKGMTLGIVGKTGSGKSTLAEQLLRNYPIFSGELLINGTKVEEFTKESIRENISMVPQEHILFTRSVKDNILIGSENLTAPDEYIDQVLEDADFKKDIYSLSHGLDTIVGEYGVTLSGGQKQRLSIARAFMKNAELLILDDSLSAVDGQTESNIIKNIVDKRSNKTNIIISHRLTAVKHADEIIVLDHGKIVERGTHEELMANKKWYYTQYNEQLMNKEE